MKSFSSQVIFSNSLPSSKELGDEVVLVFDKALEQYSFFKAWAQKFKAKYPVVAGEELKDLKKFPLHVQNIAQIAQNFSTKKMTIVAVGGGSVGDFAGFIASVYKRGVKLIHIPSTWLAAIDSAHGGKTALNLDGIKNQVGSFYPAEKIYLIKKLLLQQPEIRAHEAYSEIYKAALLQGGLFWNSFSKCSPSSADLWNHLAFAINFKNNIVKKDPFETKGIRHILNFGHTMGHVFETIFKIPHGVAVNYGICFALRWSMFRGYLTQAKAKQVFMAEASTYLLDPVLNGLLGSKYFSDFQKILGADKKKIDKKHIRFVFLSAPGKYRIESVTVNDILAEVKRQSQYADI